MEFVFFFFYQEGNGGRGGYLFVWVLQADGGGQGLQFGFVQCLDVVLRRVGMELISSGAN